MSAEIRQQLFNHLAEEHDLILLESQLDDIINIVLCETDAVKTLVEDLDILLKDIKSIQDVILDKVNRSNEELIRFNERMKLQHKLIRIITKYNLQTK